MRAMFAVSEQPVCKIETATPKSVVPFPSPEKDVVTIPLRTFVALASGCFEFAQGGVNGAYTELRGITKRSLRVTVERPMEAPQQSTAKKRQPKHMYASVPEWAFLSGDRFRKAAERVTRAACSNNPALSNIDIPALSREGQKIGAIESRAGKTAAFESLLVKLRFTHNLPQQIDVPRHRLPEHYYYPEKTIYPLPETRLIGKTEDQLRALRRRPSGLTVLSQ